MIISLLCAPLFLIVSSIISLLPNSIFQNQSVTGLVGMFSTAFQFFPSDVWILSLGSITFWITLHAIYGLINFILRLIPILNMGQ